MDLIQHADSVEKLLKGDSRIDAYEIMLSHSRDLSIEAKGGKLDAFKCAEPSGVAIRLLCGQGLGFSYSTALDQGSLSRMIEGAIVGAQLQSHDPAFVLPEPVASYPETPGIFDENLPLVPEELKVERALELERLVLSGDSRVKRVRKCSYGESIYTFYLRNSHGLVTGYRGSLASCSVSVVAEAEGDAQTGWDFGFAPGFDGIDLEKIASGASRKATSLLGATTIPSMRCPVIFANRVATELLELTAASFMGENVHKGKSLFAGKVGEPVFSDLVTVRDNGLLPGGMGTAPCDAEGVPQQDTLLVSNGVLQGFLFNSYWGKKMGFSSTGNSVRGGFKAAPRMEATNLYIETGDSTPEALLAGVGKGVLITDVMGMHTANRISGDFSVGAAGFYLEDGVVRHPVKGIAIAGNLLDLFRGINMVADDLRFYGAAGSPAFRVAELDVSGR
jgi:PmbA protein